MNNPWPGPANSAISALQHHKRFHPGRNGENQKRKWMVWKQLESPIGKVPSPSKHRSLPLFNNVFFLPCFFLAYFFCNENLMPIRVCVSLCRFILKKFENLDNEKVVFFVIGLGVNSWGGGRNYSDSILLNRNIIHFVADFHFQQ